VIKLKDKRVKKSPKLKGRFTLKERNPCGELNKIVKLKYVSERSAGHATLGREKEE